MKKFLAGSIIVVSFLFGSLNVRSMQEEKQEQSEDKHSSTCPIDCKICKTAIEKALDFLASVQDEKGGWDIKLRKPQKDEKKKADKRWASRYVEMPYAPAVDARIGITSLAGLAFLSQGSDLEQGKYKENIKNALEFILKQKQKKNGALSFGALGIHPCEETALAVIFLLEVYMRSPDERIKKKLEQAIRYVVRSQQRSGGWGYAQEADTPNPDNVGATYTVLASLLSAREGGFNVKGNLFLKAIKYLKSQFEGNGMVAYTKTRRITGKAGPPGLYLVRPGGVIYVLCRMGEAGDKKVKKVIKYFCKQKKSIVKQAVKNNDPHFTHGLLFAAFGMYQIGEEDWKTYYELLRDKLLKSQNEDGSWGPKKDFILPAPPTMIVREGARRGGLMKSQEPRVYETARFLIQLQLPLGNLKTLSQREREY
jgi:hypothetical protein